MTWVPGVRIFAGQLLRPMAKLATRLLSPPRVITGRDAKDEYLSRWYVKGKAPEVNDTGNPVDNLEQERESESYQIYLHRFHRSDNDGALHNHPWAWAFSIVLSGGYSEERRGADDKVYRKNVFPLSVNIVRHGDYHRVDLFEVDAWSIFVVGPRVSSWSFWDRDTKEETPWREFLARSQAS